MQCYSSGAMVSEDTQTGVLVPTPIRRPGPACLVIIYGRELGRRWMLDRPDFVIGRAADSDLVLDMESVSRRHCEIRTSAAGVHHVLDLGSTNGTFVNDEEVNAPAALRNGDLVKIGGAIFKYLDGESLESLFHEEIYRMTIVDGLTQAHNKRYLLEYLEREMARSHRYGRELSIMMMDIDRFKSINDEYGHIAGDQVLREIAVRIAGHVRREECFARYGGEEFAVVVPEAAPVNVVQFAEKIRRVVSARPVVFERKSIPVTLSVGIAHLSSALQTPTALIAAADERLYEAKRSGRNRVVA